MPTDNSNNMSGAVRSISAILEMVEKEGSSALSRLGIEHDALARLWATAVPIPGELLRRCFALAGMVDERAFAALRDEFVAVLSRLAELEQRDNDLHGRIEELQEKSRTFAEAMDGLAAAHARCAAQVERMERRRSGVEATAQVRERRLQALRELNGRIASLSDAAAVAVPTLGLHDHLGVGDDGTGEA